MLRSILRKIPLARSSYRTIKPLADIIVRELRNIPTYITQWLIWRYKRSPEFKKEFENSVERWNFNSPFSELLQLAVLHHDYLEQIGNQLVQKDKTNPKGYALLHACYEFRPKKARLDIGWQALLVGIELVTSGRLKEAVEFFIPLQKIFSKLYEPYAILYHIILEMQCSYRESRLEREKEEKKPLIIAFVVWGDRYINLFSEYCIPSMLAAGNIPELVKMREVSIDIYAHKKDITNLKKSMSFKDLADICDINFIEFPEVLVTCDGYKANNHFRYNIYGGFHHLSIERARSIGADIICLGPDNLFSDGVFSSYIKYIDEGYEAVLSTSMRAQAEALTPFLDKIKDPQTNILSVSADEVVEFSAQYIHNNFLQYVVTDNFLPPCQVPYFIIPHKHGFYIRGEHFHAAIISAKAIDKSKNILWRYTTLDAKEVVATLFPNEEYQEKIKIITDSDDGIMLDITYGSPDANPGLLDHISGKRLEKYSEKYFDEISKNFNRQELWTFMHTIDYRMKKEMRSMRAYLYDTEGFLKPKEFPLLETSKDVLLILKEWSRKKSNTESIDNGNLSNVDM